MRWDLELGIWDLKRISSSSLASALLPIRVWEDRYARESHGRSRPQVEACGARAVDASRRVHPRRDPPRPRRQARRRVHQAGDCHRLVEGSPLRREAATAAANGHGRDEAKCGSREPCRQTAHAAIATSIARDPCGARSASRDERDRRRPCHARPAARRAAGRRRPEARPHERPRGPRARVCATKRRSVRPGPEKRTRRAGAGEPRPRAAGRPLSASSGTHGCQPPTVLRSSNRCRNRRREGDKLRSWP